MKHEESTEVAEELKDDARNGTDDTEAEPKEPGKPEEAKKLKPSAEG